MSDPTPETDDLRLLPGEQVVVGTPLTFEDELRSLLNRYSLENRSDTPDFILATFLSNVLIDYSHAVRARDKWWGHEPSIGGSDG